MLFMHHACVESWVIGNMRVHCVKGSAPNSTRPEWIDEARSSADSQPHIFTVEDLPACGRSEGEMHYMKSQRIGSRSRFSKRGHCLENPVSDPLPRSHCRARGCRRAFLAGTDIQ